LKYEKQVKKRQNITFFYFFTIHLVALLEMLIYCNYIN
jgi:hypothetical protein